MPRLAALLLPALAAAAGAGCVREEAEPVCPALTAGDLVLTEIAGPQTGNDQPGWVELYNASGAPVALRGLRVRFRRVDGSAEESALVRRDLTVAPGAYATLGLAVDDDRPDHLDYGFAGDYAGSWLPTAAVDLEACEVRVDRATYASLPRMGSYALGTTPPTAQANDNPQSWCTDPRVDAATAVPGSPRLANPACPSP